MAMSPGNQAITGGTVLRVPAIQSPDYVAGTSGWIIRSDGSAEFNQGTFRGSIEVGSLTGQHFIVNNVSTGDVIDIYNSSNQLVMKVDNQGNVTTIDPSALDQASLFGHGLIWKNQTNPPFSTPQLYGQGNSVNGNTLSLNSGAATNTSWVAQMTLNDSKANTGAGANVAIFQRGTNGSGTGSIGGSVVQTDDLLPVNNVVHVGTYHSTVVDAFGDVVIAHGAGFTPTVGVLTPWDNTSAGQGWILEWFQNPFNATNMSFFVRQQGGGIPPVGTNVGVHAVLFG